MLSSHIAVLIEKVPWVYGAILYNSQGHLWRDMLVYLKKKKKKKKEGGELTLTSKSV